MVEAGRYRILRRIGRGGMAEVFEAVAVGEAGFRRRVAVKRILPERAEDPMFARMFLDEARLASRLHHASVVSVLDYGVADGLPFQVLEYVDGLSADQLRRRCDELGRPFPVEVALYIAMQVAGGLHHAHVARDEDGAALGIVHRDVTTTNVLVSWEGDVRLVDFGIAFAHRRTEATAAGVAKGSYLYMAPEQATGGILDARTDVFALGCVLHALVAGESPLAGESRMLHLLQGAPLPLAPAFPEDVGHIVRAAVALSRHDRFASAAAMAEALGIALAARVSRDPRRLVVELLEAVREAPAPSAARRGSGQQSDGRLDHLVAVDLVLDAGGAEERRFSMQRPVVSDGADTAPEAPVALRGARRRRRTALLVVVAAAIAALGAAAAAIVWSGGGEAAPLDAGPVPVASRAPPPVPDAAAAAPPADAAAEREVPPPVRRRRPEEARRPPPPAAAAEAPDESGIGYLVVAGPGAVDLEIRVDGVRKGRAPKRLALPLGVHEVVLVDDGDAPVSRKRIEIRASHTANHPHTWRPER